MLRDIGFAEKCVRYIDSSLLYSDGLQWVFERIKETVEVKGHVPTEIEMEDKLKFVEISRRKLITAVVEDIMAGVITSEDFIKEKLTDYCRRIKFHDTFSEAQTLYNTGKIEEAYDSNMNGMNSLYSITFNDDVIIDGGGLDLVRRKYIMEAVLSGTRFIPTMITDLDKLLGGGLEKGRIGVLLAEPKKGKSVGLIHMTCAALLMRKSKVAHFILEGTTEETIMRIQSRLSGIPYYRIYHDDINKEEEKLLEKVDSLTVGRLELIPMNLHWEYTILDVEGKLKELERKGFKTDLVVIDYADLLKGRTKFGASEKRHEQAEVFRDLKKIAMAKKVALWTASQAVRPKDAPEKEYLLRAKDISESYEKVRICDFIATLNSTPREQRLGILRFHCDVYRNSDADKTIRLITNFGKMIFSSKRYPTADMPSWKRKLKRRR
jgi:archaellum biogenesis ATPase FlaH